MRIAQTGRLYDCPASHMFVITSSMSWTNQENVDVPKGSKEMFYLTTTFSLGSEI